MAMPYMRSSDGKVGKAQADGTLDEAVVVGFADDDAALDATVKVCGWSPKLSQFY